MLKLSKLNDLWFGRNTDLYRLKERSTSTEVMGANFIFAMSKAAKCFESYCGGTVPFAYILVKKSDETKFFTHYDSLNYQNPLPGTIVDSDITDPNIFDFFLISHTVKSGSVSPTYYCILFNSIPQFLVDELHMITYFLTHMYYKSPLRII
eukprot:XP_016656440.1 PREDICTED: piwi-like protein 3 [Acyrthosiphon pisum]